MYIFSTQLDDQQQSGFSWLKLHKASKVIVEENTDDDQPSETVLIVQHHSKHHKHFAPFAKHKAKPKESHPRTVTLYFETEEQEQTRPGFDVSAKTAYSDYLKRGYHYLFFREINPPPPKLTC
jgi:hypothetical protein